MKYIIDELGNVKTIYMGPNNGSFNVLNIPDEIYRSLTPEQFWEQYNKRWLDEAIRRGDEIVFATRPEGIVLSYWDLGSKSEILTGFGREYHYLLDNGYVYNAGTNMMIRN